MPPRSTIVADYATFRDLAIFEERLKDTAAGLQRRKSRYQLFLAQLLVVIAVLAVEVLLPPDVSIISVPYNALLRRLLPDIYTQDTFVILHPFFSTGLLFVSVTTLVLFFVSGTYSEKIAYANKYVPHTNKTLRSFNMYFNTRRPPLRTTVLWNPLSFFFPRPPTTPPSPPPTTSTRSLSPSPPPTPSQQPGRARSQSGSRPIPSIPPATNPRGELIFSSRVDKSFREGYERHRAAFEKKREEALRVVREQRRMERWWWVYKFKLWGFLNDSTATASAEMNGGGAGVLGRTSSVNSTGSSSPRGRPTPGPSRSGTPPSTPGSSTSSITTPKRDRSGSPMSRQPRGLTNRRNASSNSRKVTPTGSGGRKEHSGELNGPGDMRMRALERSYAAGSGMARSPSP